MTYLLNEFIRIENESREAGRLALPGKDYAAHRALHVSRLNRQRPLLARMSREELQYVLDNYIVSPQGKYEFTQKYLSGNTAAAQPQPPVSQPPRNELAAAAG
jgi:hypothetical protein